MFSEDAMSKLKAPKRYKNPRLQEIFEGSFRFSKEICLKGGGALQSAWAAGYLGKPIGRHGGCDYTSISAITYRAGQERRKMEK